jgi:enoyl-CoA hydratase
MIQAQRAGAVTTLRLAHKKASALDLELCRELERQLVAFAASDARALVLTGTGSIFSAGVDLVRLCDEGVPYVREFLPALDAVLERLWSLEKPVVAAVNGHAIAGGAILALACDLRVLARGTARFGAPELVVGVPFPQLALEIVRAAVAPACLEEVVTLGRLFDPESCLAKGLVHELCEPAAVAGRALALAGELAAVPGRTMSLHKRLSRAPARARLAAEGQRWGREVLEVWCADETLAAVRAYVRRTLRK